MATTENFVFGNGGDTYSFSFPYLKTEDVRVELQEYDATQPVGDQIISRSSISAFTIPAGNPTQIIFDDIGADTVYQTTDGGVRASSVPGEYPVRIRIYRATQPDATPATFFAGSAIRAKDLNDNFDQILYIMQEKENALISIQTGGIGDNVISTSAIQDDAVDANILRDSVSTDGDRAVTTNHIRDNAVTTAKIDNDAVTTAKLASDLTVDLTSGTVGSPSLTFDANTGLYSPGEDQVAISTNGTQRLLIDNNGRVGIGVTPESVLHVKGPQPSIILENSSGVVSTLAFKTTGNATSDFVITASSSGSGFYSNQHKFYNITGTQYMCLDSSGHLGVGTSSPQETLHIAKTGDSAILQIQQEDSSSTNTTRPAVKLDKENTNLFQLSCDGNAAASGTTYYEAKTAAGQHVFSVNGSQVVRIDSGGRLLINTGTELGGALLQVNGDRIRVATAKTPASAGAPGKTGEICWDSNYVYVCVGTDQWKRSALSSWP